MRVPASIAAAVLLAVLGGAYASPGADIRVPSLASKPCAKGSVAAVIAGMRTCLKPGQRCTKRYDRQYHRYGFHCHTGRLARRAVPAPSARNLQLVANVPLAGAVGMDPPPPVSSAGAVGMDLAFWGDLMFSGDWEGFRVIDISSPSAPKVLARMHCPAGESDISVWARLVFVSVYHPVRGPGCDGQGGRNGSWEGIRIFDVSNPGAPKFVGAVGTPCGAHTHTLVPDLEHDRVLLYVSNACSFEAIVEVPLAAPDDARLRTDSSAARGGSGCFDVAAFTVIGLAAAACVSEGRIWDISNPANPVTLRVIRNVNVDLWHSATFTWDGKLIAFGDEFFGGHINVCTHDSGSKTGAIWLYRVADAALVGHFKIPRVASGQYCTVHDYNFVPTSSDRAILVSGWYSGGTSVADVTNPAAPREIAFAKGFVWGAYWYNGFVYASDILHGVHIYRLVNVDLGVTQHLDHLNPQTQELVLR